MYLKLLSLRKISSTLLEFLIFSTEENSEDMTFQIQHQSKTLFGTYEQFQGHHMKEQIKISQERPSLKIDSVMRKYLSVEVHNTGYQ